MKLLLGENLSRHLVPSLQHDYPSSNQVVLLDNLEVITESLVERDLASVEFIPA